MTIFGAILFASFIFRSCGGSSSEELDQATTEEPTAVTEEPTAVTEKHTETNNNASEETSKKVYRQGYSDGQTGYGLPVSERASASEFYMARGYNFSSADYYVYEMGYNDGVYGRSKQY